MRQAVKVFVSGCVVYFVMAAGSACGGSDLGDDAGSMGAPGGEGQGGAPIAGGSAGAPGSGGQGGIVAQMGAGPGGGAGRGGNSVGGSSGSGPVPDADAATPGSRLKPKVFVGADGSKQPTLFWQDTQRGEECLFQRAADGAFRCLPTGAAVTGSFWNNSGCTVPVVAVSSACSVAPPPAYAFSTAACGSGPTVHAVGSSIGSTAYVGTPGSCFQSTNPAFTFYTVGAEVPLGSFVSANLTTE